MAEQWVAFIAWEYHDGRKECQPLNRGSHDDCKRLIDRLDAVSSADPNVVGAHFGLVEAATWDATPDLEHVEMADDAAHAVGGGGGLVIDLPTDPASEQARDARLRARPSGEGVE